MIQSLKNAFKDNGISEKSKRNQIVIFGATAGIIAIFIIILFAMPGGNKKKVPFPADVTSKNNIKISGVTEGAKAEDRWIEKSESKLQKYDKLAEDNAKLAAQIAELKKDVADNKSHLEESVDQKILVDEFKKLEGRINGIENSKTKQFAQPTIMGSKSPYEAENVVSLVESGHTGTMSVDFKLDDNEEDAEDNNDNVFNTEDYLPAGSYVSAIVISGVDASVGISSQGDPRPVLFRINGDAVSAIYDEEEQQKIDIKGCTVTGAASGDLSSEKVFVRLLKMTCSRESGTVIETDVHGYVTAVGKAGVRGPVVSREGDLVAKSFIAGLAGGVGSGVAQSLTTPATVVGGVATQTPNVKDIAGQGVGKGLQSSADRLADYLIKRAEQYQPVITMSAGINVELVFMDGVYLDGKKRSQKTEIKKNG